MSKGSWRCEGCGAAQTAESWSCHWCGRARARPERAPLLAPSTNASKAPGLVLVLGAVGVLVLVVSIVAMAGSRRTATVAGPTGSYPPSVADPAPAPPGMYASPADPTKVIDLASAETVLDTYWQTRREALERHDVALLRSVASGATAEWDGDCQCMPSGARVGDDYFTAPPQSGYPARFLAERRWHQELDADGQRTEQEVSDLVVFLRLSPQEPWKAVIHAGVVSGVPFDALLADPFAAPLPEVTGSITPEAVPDLLAAYFQSWHDVGAPPVGTPIRDEPLVRSRGEGIWRFRNAIEAQGATMAVSYRSGVVEDGIYEFWGMEGRLVCGTVRWTSEERAASSTVVQPEDRSLLPAFVPAGAYLTVATTGVRQVCATVADDVDVVVMAGGDTTAVYVGA